MNYLKMKNSNQTDKEQFLEKLKGRMQEESKERIAKLEN